MVRIILPGLIACCLLIMGVVAQEKPGAVLGRFSYLQFIGVTVLSVSLIVSSGLALIRSARTRKSTTFKLMAIGLGGSIAVITWEVVAFLLPPSHEMDNPWYISSSGGFSPHETLPFGRPSHLRWEGLSRGDMAVISDNIDPYARTILFETDHQGFRNGKDLTRADLVFLGDSFTEAGNLNEHETFVQLVAKSMDRVARNLGRAVYTAPTELVVLKEYGLDCQPQVVIWQITESNDLEEAVYYRNWLLAGRPPYFDFEIHLRREESWQRRSPSYSFFRMLRRSNWPLEGTFRSGSGELMPMRFYTVPTDRQNPETHEGWFWIDDSIRDGAELLAKRQIALVVIMIPMKYRIMIDFTEMRSEGSVKRDSLEDPRFARHLHELCVEIGVPFLDCTSGLRQAAARGIPVYLPMDTHLSPEGHQVVSDLIVKELRAIKE